MLFICHWPKICALFAWHFCFILLFALYAFTESEFYYTAQGMAQYTLNDNNNRKTKKGNCVGTEFVWSFHWEKFMNATKKDE